MKCENCGNEHDGSYGSGKFCSEHCRRSFCGKKNKKHVCNFKCKKAPYGTWKCNACNLVFSTRRELSCHNHKIHPVQKGTSWNKGLTKDDPRVKKYLTTIQQKRESG